jgi:hypothetical protein
MDTGGDYMAETETAAERITAGTVILIVIRWLVFIPAYFVVHFLIGLNQYDFLAYLLAPLLSAVVSALIAPSGRKPIAYVIAAITVIPLPFTGAMYTQTQAVYMILAAVISIVVIYACEWKRVK